MFDIDEHRFGTSKPKSRGHLLFLLALYLNQFLHPLEPSADSERYIGGG